MPAADQIDSREGDKRSRTADAAHRILAEQSDTAPSGVSGRASSAADTAAMVQSQDLPDLRIGDDSQSAPHESDFMHFVHGAEAVVTDLARGVVDEVVHHPGEVVGSALTGLAIGTAAVLAAPLAPVAVGLATVAGGAYGLYQLATHAGGWAHSADVVSNSQDYTKKEVVAAHQDLQGVGRGSVLVSAGVGGSFGAAPLAGAISGVFAGAASSTEGAAIGALTNARGQALLEGPRDLLRLTGPEAAEATGAPAEAVGAAAEQSEILMQGRLQNSIAEADSLFASAEENGQLITSVGASTPVRIQRFGSPGFVRTGENPEGFMVSDSYVTTELNSDGRLPGFALDRITSVDDWQLIANRYSVTRQQLDELGTQAIRDITTVSRPDPVQLVRIGTQSAGMESPFSPTQILRTGDYLARFEHDPVTGEPGKFYWRVTPEDYARNYHSGIVQE